MYRGCPAGGWRSATKCPRIAVAAHKGGAGKTTVAVNLAAAIAQTGQPVVLIDADPQGAAGAALGVAPSKPGLYEVLQGKAAMRDAITPSTTPNLSVVTSDISLARAELELPAIPDWQRALQRAVAGLKETVVIDTAPGLGVLSYVALAAAECALVVCPPEFLAYRALPQLLGVIDSIRKDSAPKLQVVGIVPTMVTRRSRHERDVLEALATDYPRLLLPDIPRRVVVADAALAGEPLTTYAPTSDIATIFVGLAQGVMNRAK